MSYSVRPCGDGVVSQVELEQVEDLIRERLFSAAIRAHAGDHRLRAPTSLRRTPRLADVGGQVAVLTIRTKMTRSVKTCAIQGANKPPDRRRIAPSISP